MKGSAWGAVVIACVTLVCVTILLALHVEATTLIAMVGTVATPVIGWILYSQLNEVKVNTNGINERKDAMLAGLVEHLKAHSPTPATSTSEEEGTASGG